MGNIFTNTFILSETEIKLARIDVVALKKEECDEKLRIAIDVAQQKDTRSYYVHAKDWVEDQPMEGARRYSRTVYLFLSNPEEVQSPDDLVWMPPTPETSGMTEYMTRSGKVLHPIGNSKLVWKMANR